MGDELTNAAMVGLLALVAFTFILRGAGSITAWLAGSAQPSGGPASGVSVLLNPSDPATALGAPGLNPVFYWITTGLMLTLTGILGTFVWLRIRRYTTTVESDPRRMAGIATRHDINATASTKALLKRANSLRPSLESPKPEEVGYLLGTSKGASIHAAAEDSIMGFPRYWMLRARWCPPAPAPTTSPPPCAPAPKSGRSRSSTPNTSPKDSHRGCAGHRSGAARTHRPR